MIYRNRYSKIIATVGPSIESYEKLEKMFLAGVDVFRLNFSHSDHAYYQKIYDHIRVIEKKHNAPIGVIGDLQGPKLRIGSFETHVVHLDKGAFFCFDQHNTPGNNTRVFLQAPQAFRVLKKGDFIFLKDGQIQMEIVDKNETSLGARVLVGGTLASHQGFNLPGIDLHIPSMSEKDHTDLDFALRMGVDWIALSFVYHANDVAYARSLIGEHAKIIVKLETPHAIKELDQILPLCHAVMVARGDLGIEIPPEQVPSTQRHIIRTCQEACVPVIVATHMLESMVKSPVPTRAEACDVAGAIYDAVDSVMLSAESSVGQFPIQCVQMMDKIIKETEKDTCYFEKNIHLNPGTINHIADDIAFGVREMSMSLKAIIVNTNTGLSSMRMASLRPFSPIIAVTTNEKTMRFLTLIWGVYAIHSSGYSMETITHKVNKWINDFDEYKTRRHIATFRCVDETQEVIIGEVS